MNETLFDHSLFYAGAAGDALGRLKGILLWIQDEDVPRGKCVEQLKRLIAEHEEKYREQNHNQNEN